MATYERESRVEAPFERVWRFYSTVDGLAALTPDWLELAVEAVRGPDGDALDRGATLVTGSQVRLSVRPFGVGPRQRWISEIVAREEGDGAAFFRDRMRQGPFRWWVHTHRFEADGDGTTLRDEVEYETALGSGADAAARFGFDAAFAYRHRRTRSLLE